MSEFSLLFPCYHASNPLHLARAFESAVGGQTRRPAEVVLVLDGPVSAALTSSLAELEQTSPVRVKRVELPTQVGLARALDSGLAASSFEIVARMDADDISLPHRFEVQLPLIEAGADLVGSGLIEFRENEDEVLGVRTPPIDPDEIRRWSRFADPFNHPTVVYRKSVVVAAGGYQDLPLMEDYWLFARMIAAGARVVNLAEPLVKYRVGDGAYARRGGMTLLRSELRLQREFRRSGFVSSRQYWRNVVVRGGYRLVPEPIRRVSYRRLIAGKGGR